MPAVKSNSQQRIERIWQLVCDIPEGSVASYGQIAEIVGIPRGARQVGYALRLLPAKTEVPWHRVVTSSGRIAFEQGSRAYYRQTRRLIMESVVVLEGRIDMRQYRWQPDLDELLWKPRAAWDDE